MSNYSEVYSKITYETAIVIFMKKDGNIRIMLGTRNMDTISLEYGFQGQALGGHDTRCNINNGNIALFDLMLGESRSFNIDRLVSIEYLGVVSTKEDFDRVYSEYKEYKNNYELTQPMSLSMDLLD